MNQPSVFISCVSPEFRQTRSRVAAILTRLGYTPVFQEIFGTEPGDLRQVLRDKIDGCEGRTRPWSFSTFPAILRTLIRPAIRPSAAPCSLATVRNGERMASF